jgi:hypothetical protein
MAGKKGKGKEGVGTPAGKGSEGEWVKWGGNRRGLRTEREGVGGGWWVNGE